MTMAAKTINSRAKGAAFERLIAQRLEALTGIGFKRNLEQVRAVDHCDLLANNPAWPFSLELKRYATGNRCKPEWREQAARAAEKNGGIPAVIYQFDRREVRVSVPFNAIAWALGHDWADVEWADLSLEGLAYLAREIMAARAAA